MSNNKQYILSPDELLFLAKEFKAKYLDALYYTLANSSEEMRAVRDNNSKFSLIEKKYLSETLRGELSIEPGLSEVLKPVFNANEESSFVLLSVGDRASLAFNLHLDSSQITLVEFIKDAYIISKTDKNRIRKLIEIVLREVLTNEEVSAKGDGVTSHLISVKKSVFGEESTLKTYLVKDGILIEANEENEIAIDEVDAVLRITDMLYEGD